MSNLSLNPCVAGESIATRLQQIHDGLAAVIERYQPSELGIEMASKS